jgi:hypothetical protein
MSKREKPKWQSIDHFFTKSVPRTQLPDDPDNQHTVDEDASSEESSNVVFPQEIETESSSTVAAHPYTRISRPPLSKIMACTILSLSYAPA